MGFRGIDAPATVHTNNCRQYDPVVVGLTETDNRTEDVNVMMLSAQSRRWYSEKNASISCVRLIDHI